MLLVQPLFYYLNLKCIYDEKEKTEDLTEEGVYFGWVAAPSLLS